MPHTATLVALRAPKQDHPYMQAWSRFSAVPVSFSAGLHFRAVKAARHDLVLPSTAPPPDSSGFHVGAGNVNWQGTALMRDRNGVRIVVYWGTGTTKRLKGPYARVEERSQLSRSHRSSK